ncbi:uncharacterized protein LOC120517373 [Polypterus senegalus]|uniref:uncharacterized protein LOC120517373 n=1 Tax=Polypterus senegalus TaxID=55291 RepID=UPI001965E9CD|nr:uncharacterized protein LOC120517373 [Polypterus senegalus]
MASLPSEPNGLECCAGTDGTCQSTVICLGIEDHCFISDDGTNVYQGCSSRSVCENPGNFSSFLQMSLSRWTECCQGSFCNQQNLTMTCRSCSSTAINYYCPNATIQCPSQWRVCATSVELYMYYQFNELLYSYNGYSSSPYFSRHCVTPDICNGSGSVNYGDESWTKLVECCTSDMCNNEGASVLLCHNCQITSPWESCENKSDSIVPCDSLSSMCSSGQDGNEVQEKGHRGAIIIIKQERPSLSGCEQIGLESKCRNVDNLKRQTQNKREEDNNVSLQELR